MADPLVSIVMAAADAASTLPRSLAAVHAQEYGGPIEVIVAAADIESAAAAEAHDATVIDNPGGTTPGGLNRAVGASSGEFVVRVDAHSTIPPNYVSRVVGLLERDRADVVGGMQIPAGTSFVERAIAAAMSSRLGAGDARYRVGGHEGPVDTVYLGAFKRAVFNRVDGYNERFLRNQDYEFCFRIRREGGTVWLDPSLRVAYQPRGTLWGLASQYWQYGTWKRFFARTYPGTLRARQAAPPLLVIALLIGLLGSLAWPWLLLLPAGYLAAMLAAGLAAIPRIGSPALVTPLALAIMHLAWGTGFLIGQSNDK